MFNWAATHAPDSKSLTDKLLERCTNEVKKAGRPRLDPSGERRDQSLHQLTPTEKTWLKEQLKARRLESRDGAL